MTLVDEALAGVGDARVPLSEVIRKAVRIARLRGDYDNLHWLELELRSLEDTGARDRIANEVSPHYTAEELSRRNEVVAKAYSAERTVERQTDGSTGSYVQGRAGKWEKRTFVQSVPEMEDKLATVTELAHGPELPPGMHTLDVHAAYKERKQVQMMAAQARAEIKTIMARIEQRVHEFLSVTEKQLIYGQVNADIFERNREYVDEQLAFVAPAAFDQITSAYRRAQEGDDEARSQALLSCRRALKSVADALYPATDERVSDEEGHQHALTDDKWRNRLLQFVKEKLHGHPAGDLLRTQLDDLDRRFKALNAAADRGVHADVTATELNQAVIQTYLTIGDLLRLRADDSGLAAVAQGLVAGD